MTTAVMSRPTVLILTAQTGSGHDSTAQAVAEAIESCAADVRVCVHDIFAGSETSLPAIERLYETVIAYAPPLWGTFYNVTNGPGPVACGTRAVALLWQRRLDALLAATRPALVLTVHPLCTRLVARVLPQCHHPARHHCLVTDLVTVHRCWASQGVDRFYVATPEAACALIAQGIPKPHIKVSGLPVRSCFSTAVPPPRDTIPSVLLLGGGYGTHSFERAAKVLWQSALPLRMTVVCGRNGALYRRLAELACDRAALWGWYSDIATAMQAADIVVTKAGSATVAEALSQARQVVTYQALPGQEQGNVALLRRLQVGHHVADLRRLPDVVERVYKRSCAGPWRPHDSLWWRTAAARVAQDLVADLCRETDHIAVSPLPAVALVEAKSVK